MNDPRYIPPGDREVITLNDAGDYSTLEYRLNDHAAFMDERDAEQRSLIRRLAEALEEDCGCERYGPPDELLIEARGVEATNE